MNLRLVRASEYIQRFNVIIKHKSDRQHIVFDALSRLISENDDLNTSNAEELDALHEFIKKDSKKHDVLYITTLVEMNFTFKKKIITEYFTNSKWKKILHILSFKKSFVILSFFLDKDDLIYRTNQIVLDHAYESRRLCISINTISDILKLAHFNNHHSEFVKCFDIIFSSWYIHDLFKHLRKYLIHCSQCQVFQTRRHRSYDSLQLILISEVSFHTITIDFILTLSKSTSEKLNIIMSITCKFSKKITLISEKFIWKAKNWVIALLSRLKLMNWGLLKTIIFDRDRKFLIDLWKIMFDKLEVKLLYSTVYHLQTDDQSERTNQIVEIALRYHLSCMKKSSIWLICLITIQAQMNNFMTSFEKISNEIVYEFSSLQSWNFLKNLIASDDMTRTRKKVIDAIIWTQMTMKHAYDRRHQSLNMKVKDFVLLRLHRGYNISITKILRKKLSDQYAESFKILKKIESLSYRLNLSSHWKIHSVISVTQLESVSDSFMNLFHRSRSQESGSIHMKDDIDNVKSFEIEKLINKRIIAREVEYLVRWKKWESQYDEWRNTLELQNALNLIQDYEKFMTNIFSLSDIRRSTRRKKSRERD